MATCYSICKVCSILHVEVMKKGIPLCAECDLQKVFEEVASEKVFPTFSRFPYQTPVEQICDFCSNDIDCDICKFGV